MIRTINGQGKYVMVNGGMPATTYINYTSSSMMVGDLRFNPTSQCIEVYDGNAWQLLGTSHATIELTPAAEDALTWAIKKQNEELVLEQTAKNNPAIADLLDQRKKIDEKIKVIEILTKDNKVGTN